MALTPGPGPSKVGSVADRGADVRDLAAFLDGEQVQAILQTHLPWVSAGGFVIRSCAVDSVRYNTRAKDRDQKRPFLCVSYRLGVVDAHGIRTPRILYAEVHPRREHRAPPPEPADSPVASPVPGRTVVHLPELDATAWTFPYDPRLSHLPEVMDPERIKRYLPYDRLPAGLDGPTDAREVRVEVLRYKPETHCAAQYDVVRDGRVGPPVFTLFGKTYAGSRTAEIHRQIEAIWDKSLAEPGSFLIAGALGHARSVNTIWQESLPGLPLLPVIGRGGCDGVLQAAATALAILHGTRPVTSDTVSIGDLLAELRGQVGALIEAFPAARGKLEPIAERVHEDASTLPLVPASLVHGDFIAKNLLLHESRLVICDFDDFAVGDPLQDVARFLVDLYFLEDRDSHLVTLRRREPGVVRGMARTFTDAYRSRAPWSVSEDHLNWHWRVQMIEKLRHYHMRQHLRPGFERDLDDIVALID